MIFSEPGNMLLGVTYNGIVLSENDPAIKRLKKLFPWISFSWDPFFKKYGNIPVDCGHLFMDLVVLERRLFASMGVYDRKTMLKIKRMKGI